MSVVRKPMNTLAPIVSRSQLFQGQSRTLLSSDILQVSDEKHREVLENTRSGSNIIFRGGGERKIGPIEFKEQRLQLLVTAPPVCADMLIQLLYFTQNEL